MSLGVGIVGCGMIANFHAKAIADAGNAHLVGCFNRSTDKANAFASEHGGKVYETLKEMISDPDVHALSCLLYTSPSPRDLSTSRMPSSA